jgi:hypothetical protein
MTITADTAKPDEWTEYTCTGCGATYSALPHARSPHQCAPATPTNRNGHPCPPWCTIDHEEERGPGLVFSHHSDGATFIRTPAWDYVAAGRVQIGDNSGGPQVSVTSSSGVAGALWLKAHDAEKLAGAVEVLAAAAPDQIRELAAAIRKAAAQITDPEAWAFE